MSVEITFTEQTLQVLEQLAKESILNDILSGERSEYQEHDYHVRFYKLISKIIENYCVDCYNDAVKVYGAFPKIDVIDEALRIEK